MKGKVGKLYIAVCVLCAVLAIGGMYALDAYGYLVPYEAAGQENTAADTKNEESAEASSDEETASAKDDPVGLLDEWQAARQEYEKIVVLDAGHGGGDAGETADSLVEKELTLAVVKKTQKLLEGNNIKVFCTRVADEDVRNEDRVLLANALHADMLVSIHTARDEDSSVYGIRTKYNDTFFLPEFGSADFGYLLLEKVAASTNEKAIGMEPEREEPVVTSAEVPVALLEIGYLTNVQECKLLAKDDYLDRIAQGICDAVLEVYKRKEQEEPSS